MTDPRAPGTARTPIDGELVTGPQADVRAAVEHALAAAGFQVVAPIDATDAGTFDGLRLVALVFQPAEPTVPTGSAGSAGSAALAPGAGSPVLELGDIVVDPHRRTVRRAGHLVELGRREFDALVVLLQNTPWVVTKRFLLERVWNYAGYDPNVVEVAICGLRRKLESHGPRVIQTIRGVGYAARGPA